MSEEKKDLSTSSPSPGKDSLTEGIGGGILFLQSVDVNRAKVLFFLGVAIYLLLSFIHYGKYASLMALESQKQRLYVHYEEPLRPVAPFPPLQQNPNWYAEKEKSTEYIQYTKEYDESSKKYEADLKEYNSKTLPAWQKNHAVWKHKKDSLIMENLPYIEKEIQRKKAYLQAWSYFNHCVRFVAVLLMAFGCMVLIFHGNPYEKAVALFILGYVVVGILKIQDALVIGSSMGL